MWPPFKSVSGIDVSSLADGTLTFSVTLTDSLGNVKAADTAEATLDQTPPSDFTVDPESDLLDENDSSATFFQISGGETGATFSYTITSDGARRIGDRRRHDLVHPRHVVSGLDLSGLADGTLTFSVTITDAAGNSGTETGAATLDQAAPAGYSITADDDAISRPTRRTPSA